MLWVWELGHAKRRRRTPVLQPMRLVVAVFLGGLNGDAPVRETEEDRKT